MNRSMIWVGLFGGAAATAATSELNIREIKLTGTIGECRSVPVNGVFACSLAIPKKLYPKGADMVVTGSAWVITQGNPGKDSSGVGLIIKVDDVKCGGQQVNYAASGQWEEEISPTCLVHLTPTKGTAAHTIQGEWSTHITSNSTPPFLRVMLIRS